MATTTNYGWTTPDDTALVKDGAAAIRTLGTSVDTTTKNLNPSTTLGDIEYRSSSANVNTRLGIGTTGQLLSVVGGVPAWTTIATGQTFTGVSVYGSSNSTSCPNDTVTTCPFNAESLDTNGFHSTTTNNSRLTIPAGKAGYYWIYADLQFAAGTANKYNAQISVNGGTIAASSQGSVGGDFPNSVPVYTVRYLAVDDYVELKGRQLTGGTINILLNNDSQTTLGMYYLGA
jgi:hypothetical protein